MDIQCDVSIRHLVLGKGVINLKTINLLTYIIINNYLENINLQKYFIYIYRSGIYSVIVTPPTRHPMWVSSGGVTLRDCDSLTFYLSAFRADTCIHMHNLCNNKSFFYIYTYTYHHSGIHYILYTYTRISLLVFLQFTITKLYI